MIEHLILVRHGETLHNVAGIAQGWGDSELSDRGKRQVEALARRVARMKPDAVYSSPLQRALTTAEAIAAAAGVEVRVVESLREMNYGRWEGKSFLDVRRTDEASYQRWVGEPDFPCPEGESHNEVLLRVEKALSEISREASRVVVVTHGTAIRIAATTLLGLPVSASRQLAQDNAAINIFLRRADRYVLKVWNDATHCTNDER